MSRVRRFFFIAGAGYLTTLANFAYTALSVPLALRFLSKEEFALWALALQIGGYLMLLDLGMSSSVSRFLANHKESIQDGEYGNVLQTGRWVLGIQALFLACLSLLGAWCLPGWLEIPPLLQNSFRNLMLGLGIILSLGMAMRSKSLPLWAHQRTDITHLAASANLITSLVVLAIGLKLGWGVYGFLAGTLAGSLWTWILPWVACERLGFFPDPAHQGRFQGKLFWRMFRFGRDVFVMQLGGLLCSGSQIIVVTKILGLEAAAIFSVATKTLNMGQQLLGRILESSAPGLTEIFVQGDRSRFTERFYQLVKATLALSLVAGTIVMLGNRPLVSAWTQGKIPWSGSGDVWIGSLLIFTVATRCLQGAFGVSGDLSRIRLLPLLEGGAFIAIALLWGRGRDVPAILAASLLAHLLVSFFPTLRQTRLAFPCPDFWKKIPIHLAWFAAWIFLCATVTRANASCGFFPVVLASILLGTLGSVAWTSCLLLSGADRNYFKQAVRGIFHAPGR